MSEQERMTLFLSLQKYGKAISTDKNIDAIIMIHEMMMATLYAKKPLFYKMLFRHSRFNIALAIFGYYYQNHTASLKGVKVYIRQYQLSSSNTLDSFLTQLRISGRLEVYRNSHCRRESLYRPSGNVIHECHDLIKCMLKPYAIFNGGIYTKIDQNAEQLVALFFFRYGTLQRNQLSVLDFLPEVRLFLTKDAGHMIMLKLFRESVSQSSLRIMLSVEEICLYAQVSRSHIRTLLREAQSAGYLVVENNLFIQLKEKFISLFRNHFSLYLAMVLYAIGEFPEH